MASMATGMMKKKIENAGIPEIEDMMDMAKAEGVRFVGCRMTVDMMELRPRISLKTWKSGPQRNT